MGSIELYGGCIRKREKINYVTSLIFRDNAIFYTTSIGADSAKVLNLRNMGSLDKKQDRVQIKGETVNIKNLSVSNCALVEGKVTLLVVRNCASVYGSIVGGSAGNRYNPNSCGCKRKIEDSKEFLSKPTGNHEYDRTYVKLTGSFDLVTVNNEGNVEVWLQDAVVDSLFAGNCTEVEGNVTKAKVGNCLYVEGVHDENP